MRIAVVADSHLAVEAPALNANLVAAAAWIRSERPDLAVHLGDITAHGVEDPTAFAFAAGLFGDLPCPVRWLPGNHDIGEDPPTAARGVEAPVEASRLSAWRAAFGPDFWSVEAEGWRLVGLNAQLLGGDDDAARAQEAWLAETLARDPARLGVMLHKPLFRDGPDDQVQHQRYVPASLRTGLWRRLKAHGLRFVLSGHVHQLLRARVEEVDVVWAPSIAYRIPDRLQERIGAKVTGALTVTLDGDRCAFDLVVPPGVADHDLGDHLDLYPGLKARLAPPSEDA